MIRNTMVLLLCLVLPAGLHGVPLAVAAPAAPTTAINQLHSVAGLRCTDRSAQRSPDRRQ